MSSTSYNQITGTCVPDGTRNGKPVWKFVDEDVENNLFRMFRSLPKPDDQDFKLDEEVFWTSEYLCEGREDDTCYCDALIPESKVIPAKGGIYSIKIWGSNKTHEGSVFTCPTDMYNKFRDMFNQSENKLSVFNSGVFGFSIFYKYDQVKYLISHCNLLTKSNYSYEQFPSDHPIFTMKKTHPYFKNIDMSDFKKERVNVFNIDFNNNRSKIVFDDNTKMILSTDKSVKRANESDIFNDPGATKKIKHNVTE